MATDAAAHFDAPPRDPLEERSARARSVSADLEAIFREPIAEAGRDHARGVRLRHGGEPAARGRLTAASLGGLAAAALAGIAAGSLMVKPAPRPPAPANPVAAQPASLPVEMAPPVQTPQAADAALAAPAPGSLAAYPVLSPPPVAPAPARRLRHVKVRHACCSYGEVQAADRRLRQAYAQAIRAGAPRGAILEARDRWAATRRRSAHDPARLVASYRAIAADLTRASEHGRAHPPRTIRARFRPRYPAWWW